MISSGKRGRVRLRAIAIAAVSLVALLAASSLAFAKIGLDTNVVSSAGKRTGLDEMIRARTQARADHKVRGARHHHKHRVRHHQKGSQPGNSPSSPSDPSGGGSNNGSGSGGKGKPSNGKPKTPTSEPPAVHPSAW